MIKVAIAGNIACGKSQVEKFLKQNFPVIDTDEITHNLLDLKSEIIINKFNNFDISDNGKINRKKLGNLVFDDENKKKILENILHPEIKKEIKNFFIKNKNEKICFVSIPLVFEANMENLFDKIIFIYANDNLRLERLIKRNNLTPKEALKRINSQKPQNEKLSKSDYIINNEEDLESLYEKTKETLKSILAS